MFTVFHLVFGSFHRKVLTTNERFLCTESCRSWFDTLVNVIVRGEITKDYRAQVSGALDELYESRAVDEEARRVCSCVRLTWRWEVYIASILDAAAPQRICI